MTPVLNLYNSYSESLSKNVYKLNKYPTHANQPPFPNPETSSYISIINEDACESRSKGSVQA